MATIKDVARLAGVSPSTASRAMHDSSLISEETKQRVRKAMAKLDYSPNFAAQNLANKSSNMIGVILPAREDSVGDNPFFIQIIQGLATICNAHDYMVSVATGQSEEELIKNIETMIKRGNIRRFVFVYSKARDKVLEYVKKQDGVRFVIIGTPYEDQETTNSYTTRVWKTFCMFTRILMKTCKMIAFWGIGMPSKSTVGNC